MGQRRGNPFTTSASAGSVGMFPIALVAELADAHGSGPCGATRGGSSPLVSMETLRWFPRQRRKKLARLTRIAAVGAESWETSTN